MIHSPEAIAKVVAETGMGEMQARYHLDGRAAVRVAMVAYDHITRDWSIVDDAGCEVASGYVSERDAQDEINEMETTDD